MKTSIFCGLVATALALNVAQAQPAADEWKFVTLLPVTGPYAGYAVEFKLGMEMGRDAVNEKGGIAGRKVSLTVLDTQGNPGQVVSLMRRACAEAFAVTGPSMSNEARVAFPIANGIGCPAISSGAAASGLTDGNRPWTFTYASPASLLTPQAIDVLVKRVKPKKAAVVVDRADPAANDQADLSVKSLSAAGVETQVLNISGNDVDFGPAVTRLAGQSPDLVVLSTTDKGAVGMLKEIKKTQLKTDVLITQSAFTPLVSAAGPEVLEGVYRYTEFDPTSSTDPRVQAFVEEFKKRNNGNPPTQLSTQAYDLMFLVKDLIEKSGVKGTPQTLAADRKAFVEQLANLKDWPSIAGPMTITPQGYAAKPVTVLVFRNGRPERVTAD